MNYITTDYILDNHTDIDGWRVQYSTMSGNLIWYNPKSDYYIYATPNSEIGEVPLQTYNTSNGDVRDMWDLVFQTNSSLHTQFEQYVQAIRNVIQLLNK